VKMAMAARDVLELDRVVLAPVTIPPHKKSTAVTSYAHRLAMAQRAVEGIDRVSVSRVEEDGVGPSFTIDLLHRLRQRGDDDIYFIIGSDSLQELPTWKDPQRVLEMCTLVVFLRGDVPARLGVPGAASMVVFETPKIDVSSTLLRTRALDGEAVDDTMVPAAVRDYVSEHRLYQQR